MPDEFLTVAEVASMLKLNQQTVGNWIDAGTLPAVRIGRRVRIKRSDFDRVVEDSYTGQKPTPSTGVWEAWSHRLRLGPARSPLHEPPR